MVSVPRTWELSWEQGCGCILQPLAKGCRSETDPKVQGWDCPNLGKQQVCPTVWAWHRLCPNRPHSGRENRHQGAGQSEMPEGWDLRTQSSPQAAYKVGIVLRVGTHLQQQPVDLLRQLLDAGVQGLLLLCTWLSKHILIQRAPA